MIVYFLKTLGVHLRAGRSLFFLSVFGVALGVASILSIQIVNRSALGAFEGSVKAVSGDADLAVLGAASDLDERSYPRVLADPDVEAAWPLVRVDVAVNGSQGLFLEVLGLDLFAPLDVPWEVLPRDASQPLARPGWVAVSSGLAERFAWKPGDSIRVTSGSLQRELHVGALVDFTRISPLASSRMAVMDIAQAQAMFGRRGRIDQIDLRLRAGAVSAEVASRLERTLGPTARVQTPEQRRQQAAGLMSAFRLNLTALSLVSLFVGGFLVFTSTQAALVRRRREFGLLRSAGATRTRVLALIAGEVGLLGLLGVLGGVPLGYAVAALNIDAVSASLSNFYLLHEIERLHVPLRLYLLAGGIGVGAALLAALLPALEMSRKPTRELLAAFTLHEPVRASAARWFVLGAAIIAAAVVAHRLWLQHWRPGGFVVGLALLLGLPLLAPWIVERVTCRLRPHRFGLGYGIKALGLRLRTASFAVAALTVAVSMLIGITLMVGSFRRTVDIWITGTLRADVYVTTESWRRARAAAKLETRLVDALSSLPEVAAVDRLRQLRVGMGDQRINLVAVDMGLPRAHGRFEMLEGDLDAAQRHAREEGAVIVSEPLARKRGLRIGGTLEVIGPTGPVQLPIAGIAHDYTDDVGGAAMDLAAMERIFGSGPINNMALYLRPGVDAQRVVDGLKARYAGSPLLIRSNRDLREEVFRIFDQTFAVTRLLQLMSLLIAVAGITLTLIVLARERIAELALYRALGATRHQIFRVFLGKGLGIAAFGLALGCVGGLALALVLIFLINRSYFGWTIAIHWPWRALAEELSTILAAAALASLYPALRASRTPATELAREDL